MNFFSERDEDQILHYASSGCSQSDLVKIRKEVLQRIRAQPLCASTAFHWYIFAQVSQELMCSVHAPSPDPEDLLQLMASSLTMSLPRQPLLRSVRCLQESRSWLHLKLSAKDVCTAISTVLHALFDNLRLADCDFLECVCRLLEMCVEHPSAKADAFRFVIDRVFLLFSSVLYFGHRQLGQLESEVECEPVALLLRSALKCVDTFVFQSIVSDIFKQGSGKKRKRKLSEQPTAPVCYLITFMERSVKAAALQTPLAVEAFFDTVAMLIRRICAARNISSPEESEAVQDFISSVLRSVTLVPRSLLPLAVPLLRTTFAELRTAHLYADSEQVHAAVLQCRVILIELLPHENTAYYALSQLLLLDFRLVEPVVSEIFASFARQGADISQSESKLQCEILSAFTRARRLWDFLRCSLPYLAFLSQECVADLRTCFAKLTTLQCGALCDSLITHVAEEGFTYRNLGLSLFSFLLDAISLTANNVSALMPNVRKIALTFIARDLQLFYSAATDSELRLVCSLLSFSRRCEKLHSLESLAPPSAAQNCTANIIQCVFNCPSEVLLLNAVKSIESCTMPARVLLLYRMALLLSAKEQMSELASSCTERVCAVLHNDSLALLKSNARVRAVTHDFCAFDAIRRVNFSLHCLLEQANALLVVPLHDVLRSLLVLACSDHTVAQRYLQSAELFENINWDSKAVPEAILCSLCDVISLLELRVESLPDSCVRSVSKFFSHICSLWKASPSSGVTLQCGERFCMFLQVFLNFFQRCPQGNAKFSKLIASVCFLALACSPLPAKLANTAHRCLLQHLNNVVCDALLCDNAYILRLLVQNTRGTTPESMKSLLTLHRAVGALRFDSVLQLRIENMSFCKQPSISHTVWLIYVGELLLGACESSKNSNAFKRTELINTCSKSLLSLEAQRLLSGKALRQQLLLRSAVACALIHFATSMLLVSDVNCTDIWRPYLSHSCALLLDVLSCGPKTQSLGLFRLFKHALCNFLNVACSVVPPQFSHAERSAVLAVLVVCIVKDFSNTLILRALRNLLDCSDEQFFSTTLYMAVQELSAPHCSRQIAGVLSIDVALNVMKRSNVSLINSLLSCIISQLIELSAMPANDNFDEMRSIMAVTLLVRLLSMTRQLRLKRPHFVLVAQCFSGVSVKTAISEQRFMAIYRLFQCILSYNFDHVAHLVVSLLQCCHNLLAFALNMNSLSAVSYVSRLYEALCERRLLHAIRKHAPFALAHIIGMCCRVQWSQQVRHALKPGLVALMSACSEHEMNQLYRGLGKVARSAFDTICDEFKAQKFSGKV